MLDSLIKNLRQPKYKIGDLLKTTGNSRHTDKKYEDKAKSRDTHNQNMKVTSPFYERPTCQKGAFCKCPFHRQKRYLPVPSFNRSGRSHHTHAGTKNFVLNKMVVTQGDETLQKTPSHVIHQKKKPYGTVHEEPQYGDVRSKVQCRNIKFQEFLKQNELYILTGKMPSPEALMEKEIYEQFCRYIMKELNRESEQKNQLTISSNSHNPGEKPQQQSIQPKSGFISNKKVIKTDRRIFINNHKVLSESQKLEMFVDLLINGKKKINLNELRVLRRHFQEEIQKQLKSNKNNEQSLKQRRNKLQKLKKLIRDQEGRDGRSFKEMSSRANLRSNNTIYDHLDPDSRRNISTRKLGSKCSKYPNKKKMSILFQMNKLKQKSKEKRVKESKNNFNRNNQFDSSFSSQESSNFSNCRMKKSRIGSSKKSERQSQEQLVQYKRLKNQGGSIDIKIGQKMHKLKLRRRPSNEGGSTKKPSSQFYQSQFQKYLLKIGNENSSRFRRGEDLPDKNERSKKLKDLVNCRTEQDESEDNYLVLKKKIHQNQKFIKKIQTKLRELEVPELIIHESDSLITQKKKIRYLSQMLPKENPAILKSMNRYLDIYSDHYESILRRPDKKHLRKGIFPRFGQNQSMIEVPEKELFKTLFSGRQVNKSLKFIDLYDNEQQQKTEKMTGWVSIPQFVTYDPVRSSNYQKILHKITQVQAESSNQSCSSDDSERTLIQTQMQEKFKVQGFEHFDRTGESCKKSDVVSMVSLGKQNDMQIESKLIV